MEEETVLQEEKHEHHPKVVPVLLATLFAVALLFLVWFVLTEDSARQDGVNDISDVPRQESEEQRADDDLFTEEERRAIADSVITSYTLFAEADVETIHAYLIEAYRETSAERRERIESLSEDDIRAGADTQGDLIAGVERDDLLSDEAHWERVDDDHVRIMLEVDGEERTFMVRNVGGAWYGL